MTYTPRDFVCVIIFFTSVHFCFFLLLFSFAENYRHAFHSLLGKTRECHLREWRRDGVNM